MDDLIVMHTWNDVFCFPFIHMYVIQKAYDRWIQVHVYLASIHRYIYPPSPLPIPPLFPLDPCLSTSSPKEMRLALLMPFRPWRFRETSSGSCRMWKGSYVCRFNSYLFKWCMERCGGVFSSLLDNRICIRTCSFKICLRMLFWITCAQRNSLSSVQAYIYIYIYRYNHI